MSMRRIEPGGMHGMDGMGEGHGMGMGHEGPRRMRSREQEIGEEGFRQTGSLVYTGRTLRVWNIPSRLVDVPALPAQCAPLRSFVLDGGGMHHGGYSINGRRFDAARI